MASFSGKRVRDRANLGHAHFMAADDLPAGCGTCPHRPTGYAEPDFGDGLIEVHWDARDHRTDRVALDYCVSKIRNGKSHGG